MFSEDRMVIGKQLIIIILEIDEISIGTISGAFHSQDLVIWRKFSTTLRDVAPDIIG